MITTNQALFQAFKHAFFQAIRQKISRTFTQKPKTSSNSRLSGARHATANFKPQRLGIFFALNFNAAAAS
jgi:hypothetical protein